MAKEVLAIPEDELAEVIDVIRTGLNHRKTSPSVARSLTEWCDEEEEYLERLGRED